MLRGKIIDPDIVRETYQLDSQGHLIDYLGRPAQRIVIGTHSYVLVGTNTHSQRIAYRRAVWACANESIPERIFKINREGDERLSNLTSVRLQNRIYAAVVTHNGRRVPLGKYPTEAEARRVEENYRVYGSSTSIRHDRNGFGVYVMFNGPDGSKHMVRRVLGPYEQEKVARGCAKAYEMFSYKVPLLLTDGVKHVRMPQTFHDAYRAHAYAEELINSDRNTFGFVDFERYY